MVNQYDSIVQDMEAKKINSKRFPNSRLSLDNSLKNQILANQSILKKVAGKVPKHKHKHSHSHGKKGHKHSHSHSDSKESESPLSPQVNKSSNEDLNLSPHVKKNMSIFEHRSDTEDAIIIEDQNESVSSCGNAKTSCEKKINQESSSCGHEIKEESVSSC